MMEHAAGREFLAQLADQLVGIALLGRADSAAIPLIVLTAVFGHEGRFAAGGQAHILREEIGIDLFAQPHHGVPACIGERLGDAHRFGHARDAHLEAEIDFGRFRHAFDRRGGAIMRRCAERDMALACEHAGCRIECDPARARHIGLGPGMEIDDILRDALRPFDRLDVRHQLDRIARDEARGEAEAAQQLHEQPGAVPAGAGGDIQRLLGRLHARFHADHIADALLELAIDLDEEVDRAPFMPGMFGNERLEQRPLRLDIEISGQIGLELVVISERIGLGRGLDEEIERIDHVEIGEQIDRNDEPVDRLGKDDPRQPVAVRILLPVDEMVRRFDRQRIIGDGGSAVGGRAQPDGLRPEPDRAAIVIARAMIEPRFQHCRQSTAILCNAQ